MNKINRETFTFLNELKVNNNREWFNDNKKRFQKIRDDFEKFVDELIPKIAKFDSTIGAPKASSCIYRIYRDTRFSPDKTPYKTHIAAFFATGGNKQLGKTGYYLHLEPGECILGGGIYMPSSEDLKLIRSEIYYNIDEFKKIINDKNFVKYYTNIYDDGQKLKTAPKGFPKDFADIDLLKFKSYTSLHIFNEKMAFDDNFADYIIKVFETTTPLNNFVNRALSFKE